MVSSKLAAVAEASGVVGTTTSLQGSTRKTLAAHGSRRDPDLVVLGGRRHMRRVATYAAHLVRHGHHRVLVIPTQAIES
jgi:nucleotide-binding universal stress UspA family protein